MPSEADPAKCAGCGACAEKCPEEAIEMKDGLPVTRQDLCIECGVCVLVCPFQARDITKLLDMIT